MAVVKSTSLISDKYAVKFSLFVSNVEVVISNLFATPPNFVCSVVIVFKEFENISKFFRGLGKDQAPAYLYSYFCSTITLPSDVSSMSILSDRLISSMVRIFFFCASVRSLIYSTAAFTAIS